MENAIKFEYSRWTLEIPANQCRPICQGRPTGQHCLACNSEGHRSISKFLFLMVPYSYNRSWDTGIREVAFSSIWNKFQTLWLVYCSFWHYPRYLRFFINCNIPLSHDLWWYNIVLLFAMIFSINQQRLWNKAQTLFFSTY